MIPTRWASFFANAHRKMRFLQSGCFSQCPQSDWSEACTFPLTTTSGEETTSTFKSGVAWNRWNPTSSDSSLNIVLSRLFTRVEICLLYYL